MAGAMGFALLGRNVETLKKTEERIKTLSKSASVVVHAGDVASENAVKTFYEKIVGQFGGADVLINNAGALTACTTGEVEPAMWWQNMVNLFFSFPSRFFSPFLWSTLVKLVGSCVKWKHVIDGRVDRKPIPRAPTL